MALTAFGKIASIPVGITVGTTALTEAELGVLSGVTPGTAANNKAVVLNGSKGITTITSATVTTLTSTGINDTNITFAAGSVIDVDFAAVAATGDDTTQTASVTKNVGTITTGALTTAAAAKTSVVLTKSGVVAGDPVLCTLAGGTNTTAVVIDSVICTTNTITVVLRNDVSAVTALNGTVAFNYVHLKA